MEATLTPADGRLLPGRTAFRPTAINLIWVILMSFAFGCSGQSGSDLTPVSARKVNFSISLDDKTNANLAVKGGYVVTNDVIVAQTKDGKFVAVSSTCTKEPTRLVFKSAESQFYCPTDLSRFDTGGKVISGPATLPLLTYIVEPTPGSSTLVIHN